MDKNFFIAELEKQADMLFRVAYAILRDRELCRDAMQDTALRAWEKRDSLRVDAYFRTWVTRICINACCDIRRKRKSIILPGELPPVPVPPPDPALSMALAALPEKMRIPLVLCYREGMTYQEISTVLRLPQATVRGRIHRAKELLRKELDA